MHSTALKLVALLFCSLSLSAFSATWSHDPIDGGEARGSQSYFFDLDSFIESENGGITFLTCQKMSGPSWLVVHGHCEVEGTPLPENRGLNSFKIGVAEQGKSTAETTFEVDVR